MSLLTLVITLALAPMPLPPRQVGAVRPPACTIDGLLARMPAAQKVGQMFMVGFAGTAVGADTIRVVRDWGVGGLILYRPNVVARSQLQALIAGAQRAARLPLLIATDEEGSVAMVPFSVGVHPLLAPQEYGRLGSAARVYGDALGAGRDLRALGITMNLAPVLDVLLDPNSPIGARSYGADPALVARLGAAAIRGYQDAGIAATAKHFLGLGDVSVDAHVGLPTVRRSLAQLERAELVPMRAAIAAGVDALMVTHAALPALDPSGTPASLSRTVVGGFIRGRLGYRGLIISDTLAMGAITARMSIAAAAVRATMAGDDVILVAYYQALPPATIRGAIDAVERAVADGRISLATVDAAVRHVLALKARLGLLSRCP